MSSTWRRTRPATGIRRSVGAIGAGGRDSGSPCARCTRPARKPSSTTRGSGRRSSTPTTGEVIAVELFVAVLGASNYTFAEATRTQHSVGLDPEPHATRRVLWRRPGGVGAGSTAHRRDGAVSLRAGRPAHVRGLGAALPHGRSFRRVRRSPATKRRSKSPCRSPNAGFWRGCGTRPSSRLAALNARIRELLTVSMPGR